MVITVQIYSFFEHSGRIDPIIETLVGTGIRCYILTDRPAEEFNRFNSQYCIVRNEKAALSLIHSKSEFMRSERDFFLNNRVKGVLADIPSDASQYDQKIVKKLDTLARSLNLKFIDINKLVRSEPKKRQSGLQLTGKILQELLGGNNTGKRVTVIDVGTNNILLAWAEIGTASNHGVKVIHRASQISALGRNIRDKKLTKAGIGRTRRILGHFVSLSRFVTGKIIVTGTSCSRESENIEELSDWLENKYGLEYHILSEEEEAELIGLANRKLFKEFSELILFDIGGGSTEFIYYNEKQMLYKTSLKLGIRRLEKLGNKDRRKKAEKIRELLSGLPDNLLSDPVLVGIGGTVTNISAVKQNLGYYYSEAVHKSILTMEDIEYFLYTFGKLNVEEIAELMPFEPLRADVISTGLQIVLKIMKFFDCKNIYVSDYGLQFGILHRIAAERD